MDKDGVWLEGVNPHGQGVDKFERINNIAINIHHFEKGKVLTLRKSKLDTDFDRKVVNLLMQARLRTSSIILLLPTCRQ
jgi:hypothetical protein